MTNTNTDLIFMNDAADFLLKRKRPASRGEAEATTDGLLCTQIIRSSLYSTCEMTAHLRAASIKNNPYHPAVAAYFDAMADECERLTHQQRTIS